MTKQYCNQTTSTAEQQSFLRASFQQSSLSANQTALLFGLQQVP